MSDISVSIEVDYGDGFEPIGDVFLPCTVTGTRILPNRPDSVDITVAATNWGDFHEMLESAARRANAIARPRRQRAAIVPTLSMICFLVSIIAIMELL
jgi:hypothetical protein